jgi:hypothetical protein
MAHTIEIDRSSQIEFVQVEAAEIEDPRGHSPETRERLRCLLAVGAPARLDPKRPDVFEIEDHERIFYVHVGKTGGKVALLAIWNRYPEDNTAI